MTELTIREAAAITAIKYETLRQNIRRGNLKATKRGRDYFIRPADLKKWMNSRRPGGRPSTQKGN